MTIVVVGLSHKTTPLSALERVAVPPQRLPKALARLLDHDPIHEGVILSTCNRTEVYATVHRFHPAVSAVRHFLTEISGVPQEEVAAGLYTYYETTAVRHAFGVASGLDSMVVGEPQILGQMREAFAVAQEEGTARRLLFALFQRALRVGKRVRSETAITQHVVSLPQAAARMASEMTGGLEERTAVVIGAGRMGELSARAVAEMGCGSVVVCNRNRDRAAAVADRLGARDAGLEELGELLCRADVVISATAATDPVLDVSTLEEARTRRSAPLVAIDLGMPRDIDPTARELAGVELRDIDDLREIADRGARQRLAELPKAEAIIDAELEAYHAWERALALNPSIAQLTRWAEGIRQAELDRAARKMDLDPTDEQMLDILTRRIVNKLLHVPVTQIKDLVSGEDGQLYLETFHELFDLEVPDA